MSLIYINHFTLPGDVLLSVLDCLCVYVCMYVCLFTDRKIASYFRPLIELGDCWCDDIPLGPTKRWSSIFDLALFSEIRP